jgi:hypothetical protein
MQDETPHLLGCARLAAPASPGSSTSELEIWFVRDIDLRYWVGPWLLMPKSGTMRNLAQIGIYQPFFNQAVRDYLDPGFIALDWLHNPLPELRELALHQHILQSRIHENHRLTGLLSPKFFSKTKLTSDEVFGWIERNPGHDLYCFNGRAFIPYIAYNSVERGAFVHPGFEQGMRRVCREIGFELPLELGRQTNAQSLQCNYWCATPSFWERWGKEIVYPILDISRRNESLAGAVFRETPYRSPTPVFLISFIYERLISYYIQVNRIDACIFPWSSEQILDLRLPPFVKDYLSRNMSWIDDIDRNGQWTAQARARLAGTFDRFLQEANLQNEANGFDFSNQDLPACKPPFQPR